jgi:hypothetical protein
MDTNFILDLMVKAGMSRVSTNVFDEWAEYNYLVTLDKGDETKNSKVIDPIIGLKKFAEEIIKEVCRVDSEMHNPGHAEGSSNFELLEYFGINENDA